MQRMFGASIAIALVVAAIIPAAAADLPQVKISDSNHVPACATPGRLMAYLRERNPHINPRFDGLATEYMRYGEQLGIRWDIAFFQMILETGALSYTGDVRADQNNFAGLGASGGGKHGERFADIASGVKAHLQHLLMYAGEHIDNPVAERTRDVQNWGVLTDWQHSIKGPMTFTLLARQWAPGSRRYVSDIAAITDGFYNGECNQPDPHPEYVQEARGGRETKPQTQVAELAPTQEADTSAKTAPDTPVGAKIAKRAIEQARDEDPPLRGLGAPGMLGSVAQSAAKASQTQTRSSDASPAVKLINPSKSNTADAATSKPATTAKADTSKTAAKSDTAAKSEAAATSKTAAKSEAAATAAKTETAMADTAANSSAAAAAIDAGKGGEIQTASVADAATHLKVPSSSKLAKCKVWTASYGGQRAILIKASTNGTTNYTVLDVNAANEKREVDAYIAAYAKGGQRVAAFPNQTRALDKAFELCPDG